MSKVVIDDREWRKLKRRLSRAQAGAHVRIGVLAAKGGAERHEGDPVTNVELAAIHEFGAPRAGVPQRSFIRRTFDNRLPELSQLVRQQAKRVVLGALDIGKALGQIGEWGAAEIKKTITAGPSIPPPLKPATIAAKKSTRALVDTGRLVDSISYEVKE